MIPRLTCLTSAAALLAGAAVAQTSFDRVASFATPLNRAEGEDRAAESSAEIIAATDDGLTLVYTDSPLGALGRIDITDPAAPKPLGNVALEGEPTSVSVLGTTAFVALNTSESFTEPSGALLALDIASGEERGRCDLGGQPDSVALAPDGSFLAVAVENERDEEVNDGALPQMPAGHVAILTLAGGLPDCAGLVRAELTGLAEVAPEDPEPEFVDINASGEIAVTLQENNHVVLLSRDGQVIADFSAGAVDLEGVDLTEDGRLSFTESQPQRLREPDAVQWIDDDHLAMANEGDWNGGARGFTVVDREGRVVHESGASFERAVAALGHYPEGRSDSKGVEPEGLAFATFDGTPLLFLLAERASVVGVYDMTDPAAPVLLQLLPSGVSPEGAVAIPSRGLLATANEADLGGDGLARAHVMIYQRHEGAPAYPTLTSEGTAELLGWGALSGLAADPARAGTLHAVSDSAYGAEPRLFTIDTTQHPARITGAVTVTRDGAPAEKLDLEGIAADGQGGFWLVSEGHADEGVPQALLRVDAEGVIAEEIAFPEGLLAEGRFGSEGVAVVDGTVWVAMQRPAEGDPADRTKLVAYDPAAQSWGAVLYPLSAPAGEGWVGLGDMAAQGDWLYLVERDNQAGAAAATKLVTRVPVADLRPAPLGGELPVVPREVVRDLLPDLRATGGVVLEKVEGLAIQPDGTAWLVTDNDATDDSSGETMLWSIGALD
ncbi:esterase-like activity of phytase family protein [Rubellimicrobium roseum]|uniref:esterase-like activity of phytase family protein n=1 Tax=Rubellimicrobium roseum TaxID=687525 RepID=UPI00159BA6AD|nr:esterase-like activity of phytase family protein [Rubellimicrobium roseum]